MELVKEQLELGATHDQVVVWAPFHEKLSIEIVGKENLLMERDEQGYFRLTSHLLESGDRYYYKFTNGAMVPDPVSRFLPEGVHGPTEIIDPNGYEWHDKEWKGLPFDEYIFYELHVGCFTKEGSYRAVQEKLPYLKKLGITCIELMPLMHFPGRCNWGYDGASLFAPYAGYGRPEELKKLIDACHQEGIAVCLDVVYNHLGPVGNYLQQFGPYFTNKYETPWGDAFNYDGPHSDEVRKLVISNALYWVAEYHIDCLRLDAIHGIYDFSAKPFLEELTAAVNASNKNVHVVAECDRNDSRAIRPKKERGYEMSGLWCEDFHHSLHTALTEERQGYYQDFCGLKDLATSLSKGFVYDNKYSLFRKRHHGNSCEGVSLNKFIVFAQNHDQIGNRPYGERLRSLISSKAAALLPYIILLTPGVPLLFMGEEYGETRPFGYFVDFEESELMQTIYEGRKKEFASSHIVIPSFEVYMHSKLSWESDEELFSHYTKCITLRKQYPPKSLITEGEGLYTYLDEKNNLLSWEYESKSGQWLGVSCHFAAKSAASAPFKYATEKVIVGL